MKKGGSVNRRLARMLDSGYTVHTGNHYLHVRDPEGRLVRQPSGLPVRVSSSGGIHPGALRLLDQAGALR
jgi:hypothetical protein